MKTDTIINQLNFLLEKYAAVSSAGEISTRQIYALIAGAHATIERCTISSSPYQINCESILDDDDEDFDKLEKIIGLIEAIRDNYNLGALEPIQNIIRAEVFDDFLDMANHLIENGYKDPSAVIIGGVLEQHLRRLCNKNNIIIDKEGKPKTSEYMNNELARKGIYNVLDQKSITSWLDLRNKAAHAQYTEYSLEQVKTFLLGVRDFISRTSSI